jgi:hypothetical protein
MYYKEWLKSGADAPPVPSVPLPSMPGNIDACEKLSASVRRSSINRNLWVNIALDWDCIWKNFAVHHQPVSTRFFLKKYLIVLQV